MRTLTVVPIYNIVVAQQPRMQGFPSGYHGTSGRFQKAPPGIQNTFQGSGVTPGPVGAPSPVQTRQRAPAQIDVPGQMNFQQIENVRRIQNIFSKGTYNPDGSLTFNNKTITPKQVEFFQNLLKKQGIDPPQLYLKIPELQKQKQKQKQQQPVKSAPPSAVNDPKQQLQQLLQHRNKIDVQIQRLQSQVPVDVPTPPPGAELGRQFGEFIKTPWRAVRDVGRDVADWSRNFGEAAYKANNDRVILTANMGSASSLFK